MWKNFGLVLLGVIATLLAGDVIEAIAAGAKGEPKTFITVALPWDGNFAAYWGTYKFSLLVALAIAFFGGLFATVMCQMMHRPKKTDE